jgi:NAD(P)H-dependent flavin oxidoreductase YrpB (nitropropane dioxygenase family)
MRRKLAIISATSKKVSTVVSGDYQKAIVEAQETDTFVIERTIGRPALVLKGRTEKKYDGV